MTRPIASLAVTRDGLIIRAPPVGKPVAVSHTSHARRFHMASRGYRAVIRHGLRRGLPSKAGFSRRDFLKRSGGAAAAAVVAGSFGAGVGGCGIFGKSDKRGVGMKAVVVGAGFGGLAAADALRDAGADVTVLEASKRPGGRVLTDRRFVPNKTVELGGEFIGENHPTYIRLASKFDVERVEVAEYEGESAIILDGKLIQGASADKLWEDIDGALAEIIEMARGINPTRPYTSPNAAELDKQSFLDKVNSFQISDEAKRLMLAAEEADQGVPPDRMSLLAYLALVAGHGFEKYYEVTETHRIAGGNDRLATAMAKSLGERVKYGQAVASIERRADGATVTTADGTRYDADAVVLAIPPSVWESVKMNPALDGNLKPQMGSNVKLILALTEQVWVEKGVTPDVVSDGLVNLTWVSADAGKSGPPIGFTLFSGGQDSETLRAIPENERTSKALASITPAYPSVPHRVKDARFIDWPGMALARASYSFPAPGQVTALGPTLVDGVSDGMAPLKFAGEHTSYGFIGYMEGALSSGVRAANQLLKAREPAAKKT